jgi:hypothetical protein
MELLVPPKCPREFGADIVVKLILSCRTIVVRLCCSLRILRFKPFS